MFKRKCHEHGGAIRVYGSLVILCHCVTPKEIRLLIEAIEENVINV